jgi:hypothetical protein
VRPACVRRSMRRGRLHPGRRTLSHNCRPSRSRAAARAPCAVFNAGRTSMLSFQAWRYNTEERMEAAPIVRAMRRRKLGHAEQLGIAV